MASSMITCATCKSTLMSVIGGLIRRRGGWRRRRMRFVRLMFW